MPWIHFILPLTLRSLCTQLSKAAFFPPPLSSLLLSSPLSLSLPRRLCLFSPLQPPPPTPAGPRGASRMTGGRLRPVAPAGGGLEARTGIPAVSRHPGGGGPGGSAAAALGAERRRMPGGRAQADARDAHAGPRILCPARVARASGLGPAIRSRKSEPCQVSAWPLSYSPLRGCCRPSVEATPSPWAQDTGKDFVRVQKRPEPFWNLKCPPSSRLTLHDEKHKPCRLAQTHRDHTRNPNCPQKLH